LIRTGARGCCRRINAEHAQIVFLAEGGEPAAFISKLHNFTQANTVFNWHEMMLQRPLDLAFPIKVPVVDRTFFSMPPPKLIVGVARAARQ